MKNKKKRKQKPTLKQLVAAAHEAGIKVNIALVLNGAETNGNRDKITEERLLRPSHGMKLHDYPGTPGMRSILAYDATDQQVSDEFKTNPNSQWVITTTRAVERDQQVNSAVAATTTT